MATPPVLMQPLLGLVVEHIGENLQPVAVRVEEIDALAHYVIHSPVNLHPVVLQLAVQLLQFIRAALDFQGDVVQAQVVLLQAVGRLAEGEESDVVVLLAKGEEGHVALRVMADHFHPQHLGIEVNGSGNVAAVQYDVL